MKVVVLGGGDSAEREVSLATGREIIDALRASGHDVISVDPAVEDRGLTRLLDLEPDVVFNALHGGDGEDGHIQATLDRLGVPYTGSGFLGCALAMDKLISKKLFSYAGIPTPPWVVLPGEPETIESELGYPVVVKPVAEGSTVGVTLVKRAADLDAAVARASRFGGRVLVERFIAGRELAVAVLGSDALPIVEIVPKHEIYDYDCKYTKGMSEYRVPAPLEEKATREVQSLALAAHRILRMSAYSRIDFRMDDRGAPWCLEGNSLPGMTATSLLPKAAAAAGIPFGELCERIVRFAVQPEVAGTPSVAGG